MNGSIDLLVRMLNEGRFEEVERGARALLRGNADAGIAWKILGAALMAQGKEALEVQVKTAELMPDDAEAHAILGAALQDRRRWAESAASYRRSLAIDARSLQVQNNLGNVLLASGHFAEAVECLRCAVLLGPEDAATHSNLGNALRRLGRATEAIASCRRAIRLDPKLSAAHDNLGLALAARGHFEEAVASHRRSLALNPNNVVAVGALGGALRDLGEQRDALNCYLRAVELAPRHATAWFDLGNAMMDLERADEAAASYRQVLALEPGHEAARLNMCMILRQEGKADAAEALCRVTLADNPQSAEALTVFGELCADRGSFASAEKSLQHAISINPDLSRAWALIAAHRKMTAADSVWLASMERLLAARPPLRQEIRLRYALGKYFDDVEQYDQAFENFRQANVLNKRSGLAYDRSEHSRRVDEIIEGFDRGFLEQGFEQTRSTLPVVIVGMPRSGTSLVEQILASHPAVFGAGELNFWDKGMSAYRERGADILADWAQAYLDHLRKLSGGALHVVDKMPANFMNVGLIHAALPDARIIHVRRSPADTCLSIYFHYFPRSHAHANDLDDLAHYYAEYARLMDHWRAVLPTANFLEISYETLIADQEGWTRRMLDFIGLPWDPQCLDFHRSERVVITASRWQVRQRISPSSVGRWRHYANHIDPLRRLEESTAGLACVGLTPMAGRSFPDEAARSSHKGAPMQRLRSVPPPNRARSKE